MLSKKEIASSLPDPRRCQEKDPVAALDALVKQFLEFRFGYRAGNRLVTYGYRVDFRSRKPIGDLIVTTLAAGAMTHGPDGETLSDVIRRVSQAVLDVGGTKPDLATLWVGGKRGPLPRMQFAELVGAALAVLTGAETPAIEDESWPNLAQRATGRGAIELYFDLDGGGRIILRGNGDGAFDLFDGENRPTSWFDIRDALGAVAETFGPRIDAGRVGVFTAKDTWVRSPKLPELLARAVLDRGA
jgi:hypothetical protein